MKTIKQIARELGISPQALYKQLKNKPELMERLKPHTAAQGVKKFNSLGEKMIKEIFKQKKSQVEKSETVENKVEKEVEKPETVEKEVEKTKKTTGTVENLVEYSDAVENMVENIPDSILISQMRQEITFLREQLIFHQDQLIVSEERNHELAIRLSDLVKNNQSLIALLNDEKAKDKDEPQPGIIKRFFNRYQKQN